MSPALTEFADAVTAPALPTAVAVMTDADTATEPASKSSCKYAATYAASDPTLTAFAGAVHCAVACARLWCDKC